MIAWEFAEVPLPGSMTRGAADEIRRLVPLAVGGPRQMTDPVVGSQGKIAKRRDAALRRSRETTTRAS